MAIPLLFEIISKDNFPVVTCRSDNVRAGLSGLGMLDIEKHQNDFKLPKDQIKTHGQVQIK